MKIVGIDIGSYSVKVAEVEGFKNSCVLHNFFEIALTHELGQDLRLEKIEALRRIITQYDPEIYTTVVGIGSEHLASRNLTFPFLERRKVLQSLAFELEDVIPFSQSDAIFDFRAISQRGSSTRVLALAIPKKYIQEVLHLCDDAGFSPDIICPDGIALANHFENYNQPPRVIDPENTLISGPAQIVVHIGYTRTLINIMQDRNIVASRALFFGGRDLAAAISRAYQLPYLNALKGVAEKGFVLTSPQGANADQLAFSQTISTALNGLVSDLQRTIVDLKAELQTDFDNGYLLGGMGHLINLGPYLEQKLGVPFGIHPVLGKNIQSEISVSDENEKSSSVVVGLAMEGLRKPKNPPVNFRRNEFSKQNQTLQNILTKYRKMAGYAAALFVIFFIYASLRSNFAQDNVDSIDKSIHDQAKNPILNLTSSQLKSNNLNKIIKAKRDEIESRKQIAKLNQMASALDVMRSLSNSLPSKSQLTMDITHFDIEGERTILEGTVNSPTELDILKRSLTQMGNVSDLKGGPRGQGGGKVPFTFAFNFARLPSQVEKSNSALSNPPGQGR